MKRSTESRTPKYSAGSKLWPTRLAARALLRNEGARYQSDGRWNLRFASSLFRFRLRNTAVRLLHDRPKETFRVRTVGRTAPEAHLCTCDGTHVRVRVRGDQTCPELVNCCAQP